jgi:hypothetical protein
VSDEKREEKVNEERDVRVDERDGVKDEFEVRFVAFHFDVKKRMQQKKVEKVLLWVLLKMMKVVVM